MFISYTNYRLEEVVFMEQAAKTMRQFYILAVSCAVLATLTHPAPGQTAGATSTQPAAPEPARKVGETVTLPSGLQYKFTQLGKGPAPRTNDLMIIHGIGSY